MIRLRNCRRRKKQRAVIERLASKLWLPKLWLPMSPGFPCCCPDEGCLECTDGDTPDQFSLVLSGVAEQDPSVCGSCTDLNNNGDPYILDHPDSVYGVCYWSYTLPTAICLIKKIVLEIIHDAGYCFVTVRLQTAAPSTRVTWQTNWPDASGCDCVDFSSETISSPNDISTQCDFSGASVSITAV